MKRVLVIGSSGAGKSAFARRLHEKTNLPLIHLDRLYWKPGWIGTTDENEWRETLAEILQGDEWIIDGNYSGTLELRGAACDTIIMLDVPHYVCAWRVLKRSVFYRRRVRPDMADGCEEKLDLEFLKLVWNYPKRSKPKVERLLRRFEKEKTVIHLKSTGEIENFFANLAAVKLKSI